MMEHLEVRKINPGTFDIFFGNQWGEWVRIRRTRNDRPFFPVSGNVKVSRDTLEQLSHLIFIGFPVSHNQRFETTVNNLMAM